MVLLPFAALLLGFSFMVTTEAESPESFPGLRDNTGDVALLGLLFSAAATVLALVLVRRARRRFLVPMAVLCALLMAVSAYRAFNLWPMLDCAGHSAVARQADGSYRCYDR